MYSREGSKNGPVPVHCDGSQCEHTHRHADHFHKGTEAAEEGREYPPLQQCRLELTNVPTVNIVVIDQSYSIS